MNKLIKWSIQYFSLAITLLTASCSPEDYVDVSAENDYDGVTIEFCITSELTISTRTELTGAENMQHVQNVHLYIFNESGVCISSEDVKWKEHFEGLPGGIPMNAASMTYRVKYRNFTLGSSYTLLAVGCDAESSHTYGLPSAIRTGSLSADAKATLQTDDWRDIHTSELLSGKSELRYTSGGTKVRVNLYRRVAGVMGWFSNLPSTIDGVPVSSIRISLYKKQNKSVPLFPLMVKPIFRDYTNDAVAEDDGEVLVEIPVVEEITPAKVFSKGSYILPVPAPPVVSEDDYTLRVELVGDGKVLRYKRTKLGEDDPLDPSTGSGTGIIDTEGPYRFPIIANHFYGIGTPATPIDLGGMETDMMVMKSVNLSAFDALRD